jgi:hypothetical protein
MNGSKRKLRVLHLASFAGNIGDLANHAGGRRMLAERLGFVLEFTDLEIREFYWKQRSFDDAFVDYANSFDLLIIGSITFQVACESLQGAQGISQIEVVLPPLPFIEIGGHFLVRQRKFIERQAPHLHAQVLGVERLRGDCFGGHKLEFGEIFFTQIARQSIDWKTVDAGNRVCACPAVGTYAC